MASDKYHVAFSFAGEDRKFVEDTALLLRAQGVDVFYDKFEEATLWGKDLYEHLSDVYQNKAIFTVMFISEYYEKKVWATHERKSAQARALTQNQEYILPAFFGARMEVPGLLKTTGYISLKGKTPTKLAELIIEKLKDTGVKIGSEFQYSEEAKADVDFPVTLGDEFSDLIKAMKTYNWYQQSPAIISLSKLDWNSVNSDQTFVLGRNVYQCACGNERQAIAMLANCVVAFQKYL